MHLEKKSGWRFVGGLQSLGSLSGLFLDTFIRELRSNRRDIVLQQTCNQLTAVDSIRLDL